MVLIIGGSKQGKLRYVLDKTGFSNDDVVEDLKSAENKCEAKILYALQNAIREAQNTKRDPFMALERILSSNPDIIIICDEVGGGVVPIHPEERVFRETVGRVCCMLADRANHVERVLCGISMRLKGDGEWS